MGGGGGGGQNARCYICCIQSCQAGPSSPECAVECVTITSKLKETVQSQEFIFVCAIKPLPTCTFCRLGPPLSLCRRY